MYLRVDGEPPKHFPIRSGYRASFQFGLARVPGTCFLPPDVEAIGQGQWANITVELAPTRDIGGDKQDPSRD